ncbi:MerR family transcriptional regulator [Paenibacillus sp. HJL G12]|uniref:MerR family transcriptional regulator n=1 Tax=Paenibacillus dendrobii TaxID=2691084 RepID=A0A7X3IHE5_9BACL|nr:MerR family transcriptional regulator [Paenibacillus dendrobii]MWV43840.1 MerR family transcriptional regulator [Paenibacillus dendrobii]
MDEYKIDDVARECGLTKRTIRYYEELGVFPAPDRSEGGIRIYTREHIDYLKKIVNAKDILGFGLQELVQYLSVSDAYKNHHRTYHDVKSREEQKSKLTHMQQMLDEQIEMLRTKIEKMKNMQSELEQTQVRLNAFVQRFDEESAPKD